MMAQAINQQPQRKIMVLPDHLANQIAAGEVIQRPESVAKELLENAFDAGATHVTVTVRDGGMTFLQVADDGCGMGQEDAVTAFLRHATNKIASMEELDALRTYGFRGEALASIASVAQVALKTRREEDDAAVMVKIDGGGQPRVTREARERGTTVTVQNLFFNVPARKKFLKAPSTEYRHIYESVHRAALSRPDCEITLVNNDETVFHVKPGTLEQRMLDLFGERLLDSVIPVEERTEDLAMSGFIGKPAFGQKTRAHQYLFLNRRYIVHRNISHAVFSSYENLLLKGSFPFYVLFLELDPSRVDVNVHPSKLEAKFDDEHAVYRMAAALARKALAGAQAVPGMQFERTTGNPAEGLVFTPRQHAWSDGAPLWPSAPTVDIRTGEILSTGGSALTERLFGPPADPAGAHPQGELLQHDNDRPEPGTQALLWQLHNKYILCQIRSGLMIVDQHVAHERVLYERILERFRTGERTSQQLLFPHTVQLSAGDAVLLEELLPHLTALGFDVKPFGGKTAVIEGVPPDVKPGAEERILQETLDLYREYQQHRVMDMRDTLAKAYSCRSAIKAGDPLSEPEMRALVDQLFATSMPYVCPHGRPVVLRIPLDELDRRFGRL